MARLEVRECKGTPVVGMSTPCEARNASHRAAHADSLLLISRMLEARVVCRIFLAFALCLAEDRGQCAVRPIIGTPRPRTILLALIVNLIQPLTIVFTHDRLLLPQH